MKINKAMKSLESQYKKEDVDRETRRFAQLADVAGLAARALLGIHTDYKLLTINMRIKARITNTI